MMVGDDVTFRCGILGILRIGTSLWGVPITGSIYLMMVGNGMVQSFCVESREYRGQGHLSGGFPLLDPST
ncbi:unnamed protein product [Staurois parvus]|uniref:Uncharacterized protein n=1 Tax=Staurois parvus TaxID=386267 RepID=A0ABN9CJ65_9NEOB|nr:unnamed protein product [Staurois parvus]